MRIHLDEVEGLGHFVEFEAVGTPGSDLAHEGEQVEALRQAFEISSCRLIGGSYCDLMLEAVTMRTNLPWSSCRS